MEIPKQRQSGGEWPGLCRALAIPVLCFGEAGGERRESNCKASLTLSSDHVEKESAGFLLKKFWGLVVGSLGWQNKVAEQSQAQLRQQDKLETTAKK